MTHLIRLTLFSLISIGTAASAQTLTDALNLGELAQYNFIYPKTSDQTTQNVKDIKAIVDLNLFDPNLSQASNILTHTLAALANAQLSKDEKTIILDDDLSQVEAMILNSITYNSEPKGVRYYYILCDSRRRSTTTCEGADRIDNAVVIKFRSKKCVAGTTYGFTSLAVWVSNGCKADFQTTTNP